MKTVTLNFRYNWLSRNMDHLELDLQLVLFSFHSLLDYTGCGVKLHAHSVFAAINWLEEFVFLDCHLSLCKGNLLNTQDCLST